MRKCIGIDVAKKHFDVHVLATGQDERFSNDDKGIQQCLQRCQQESSELIVMEATGGYESLLAGTLRVEGLAVAVVIPSSPSGNARLGPATRRCRSPFPDDVSS